jgi:3',5'-cyclic AMP phosphodiesterase CpdA
MASSLATVNRKWDNHPVMNSEFKLVHISDPHLAPLPKPRAGELMSKRILGYLSWMRRRRNIHRMEVLEALERDLAAEGYDHLAITGDLTNISLPDEFSAAARWLERLGPPEKLSVIPGNHDSYVPLDWAESWGKWAAYMGSNFNGVHTLPGDFSHFPAIRQIGQVALIGLSTAIPTPWGFASGTLGEEQLEKLESTLEETKAKGLCRVVLLHHPPAGKISARKRLTDAHKFQDVISRKGAELILHGHDHSFQMAQLPGPEGDVPVYGVPSASAARGKGRHPPAQYLIFSIANDEDRWRTTVRLRAYDPEREEFTEKPL